LFIVFVVMSNFSMRSSADTIISELKEIVKSFLLKELGVGTKFGEGLQFLDFNEGSWHSSGFPVVKIGLEKSDSRHGFVMFSGSSNENERGITSFIVEFFNEIFNFMESVINISNIVMRINNFLLYEFSVGNSIIIDISIGVHNGGEGTNLLTASVHVVIVTNVQV